MCYGTKTLDDIIREVERARDRADQKVFEWTCEYETALDNYETRRRVSLLKRFGCGDNDASKRIEAAGVEVYEFDIESPRERVKCTARAIKHLRSIEKKLDEWHRKYIMAEDALDALY